MGSHIRERAIGRIAELSGRGHDLAAFWQEATGVIGPAVPFYLTPCFYTMDPASLLITSHYHDGLPEMPREWLALEYYEDDYNKMADVARSDRGLATLHEATGGDLGAAPGTASRSSRSAASKNCSSAFGPGQVRCGASSASTASQVSGFSAPMSSTFCGRHRSTWRALAARC